MSDLFVVCRRLAAPAASVPLALTTPRRRAGFGLGFGGAVGLAVVLAVSLAGCGGSSPDEQAVATSARERTLAATTSLPVALPVVADPMMEGLSIPADAATRGMWSAVQPWPMNAIHAVLLPDGRVLSYGAPQNGDSQNGRTFDVWTPSLGFGAGSHATTFEAGRADSFCSAAVFLQDGRLMVTGGNAPRSSNLFTGATGAVTVDAARLADDRWYATLLPLPDGRAVIMGGIDPYTEGMVNNPEAAIQNGQVSMTPEVYTPGTGWRSLTGARSRDAFGPDYLRASYPRAWVAPNGQVFGLSAETMWMLDVDAGQGAGSLRVLGRFKTPASAGTPVNVGATSTAVMFAPGRILQLGGNGYFNGDGLPASNMATVIDINGAEPVLAETARMTHARRYPNAVVLPNGQVVVTGGTRVGNNGGADAVYAAEIWNPATGTWATGASAARIRVYHSSTLLMPNGTVLSLGGGTPGPQYNQNVEVFYPPYLFRAQGGGSVLAPRPVVTGLSARTVALGGTLQVEMRDDTPVARLVLVGNGIVTHSFNSGQRFVELNPTQAGDRLTATLPASAATLPPGHYQLFALDAAGVPSRAASIEVTTAGSTPPPPPPPVAFDGGRVSDGGFEAAPRAPAGGWTTYEAGQSFGPWRVEAGTVDIQDNAHQGAGAGGAGGLQHLDLNGNSYGTVAQTLTGLVPGAAYTVTLKLALHPLATAAAARLSVAGLSAVLAPSTRGNVGWETVSHDFIATAASHELRLAGTAGAANLGVLVDDVRVAPSAVLAPDQAYTFGAVNVAGQVMAVDAAGRGVLRPVASPPSAADAAVSRFIVRSGLADASCVSLELAASPGRWLRHAGYRLQLGSPNGTQLFRDDATFCPEAGLAGGGVTLRSKNFPGHVLRHRNFQLWIDPVAADAGFRADATFLPQPVPPDAPPPTWTPAAVPPRLAGSAVAYAPALDAPGLAFRWDFGDGSAPTDWSATSAVERVWSVPGVYSVTLTARDAFGRTAASTFAQAVHSAPLAVAERSSSMLMLEPRGAGAARLWAVNPDNQSVSVFDTASGQRLAEVPVGNDPRSVARAPNGQVWVVNRGSASVSVIDPSTLAVVRSRALPRGSMPHGLVFAPDGRGAYVALEATGRVLRLDPVNAATRASGATVAAPRHLALTGDSSRLLVARWISAPLPGEGTAAVQTAGVGGELAAHDSTGLARLSTVVLGHSDRTDNEIQGSGIPNYLGAPALSPDGRSAWVPSKQDNVTRGVLRNGLPLDFQNTVRAVSSRIDLAGAAPVEVAGARVDHDNASLASAAVHDPTGAYLFVALETSRQVAVLDAARGRELFRVDTGLAPRGVLVSDDGLRLFVHNTMDRSIDVVDLEPLMRGGQFRGVRVATLPAVTTERLPPAVLRGKQLFHDARDPRLARDAYMSCASCHQDGAHDGRTWDFTGFGEGLRNTPSLLGRAGIGHGRLHWSGNFDEVQDFESQIRAFSGGTGLMDDTLYFAGTRAAPLGDAKAGQSADLDALAAYVSSLAAVPPSAARPSATTLTAGATIGRAVFAREGCASCHGGASFAGSGAGLVDIGTLKPASGQRLGAALPGLDVPTLRDVASTAPYLHDGSAATLQAAVAAHRGMTLGAAELDPLVEYLVQIGSEERTALATLPEGSVPCAGQGGTCRLPAGTPATVYFGAGDAWTRRTLSTGSLRCNATTFGDPAPGVTKSCRFVPAVACASEGGTCTVPAGARATVAYGANGLFHARGGVDGAVACTNDVFGDPAPGVVKACWRY